MATLTIGDRKVTVDDAFLKMSPDEQQATVDEIADSLGLNGGPEASVGRGAGLTARGAVQAAPGAAVGLPAMIYDGIQEVTNLGYRGIDALAGTNLAERHNRGRGGHWGVTNNLSRLGDMAADAVGLPEPATPEERVYVSGVQTGLETLGGAGFARLGAKTATGGAKTVLDDLADAPKTQATIGTLAGGGAQVAAENDVNPMIGMAGGMAAGVGGVAAAHGVVAGIPAAKRALDGALLRSDEARQAAARNTVRRAASDPDAALRALEDGGADELVPGSRPTTFQATGDLGLGGLERRLQTENPEAFANRRGEQNSARVEALRSVGGDGDAEQVVTFLRGQLDEIDRTTLGDETRARSAAEAAAEKIRPADEDAAALGRTVRGSMRDAEETARLRERDLWNAVDPDGTLEASPQGTREAAFRIYGKMSRSAELGLTSDEKAIRDLIGDYQGMVPFRELVDLSSQVKEAMRTELRTKGRTKAYGRLAELSGAIRDGMARSAAVRVADDPVTRTRFQGLVDEFQAGSGEGVAAGNRAVGALRAGAVPGLGGEASAQGRGLGASAGGAGLPAPAGRQSKPVSLVEYIARNGGIELTPEAKHYGWDQIKVGGVRLARPGGKSLDDHWRHDLREAGYLRRDADGYHTSGIDDELYELIDRETKGRGKAFSAFDEGRASSAPLDGYDAELRAAEKQIRGELQSAGIPPTDLSTRALNEAADLLARGDETDAITAYERAVMNMDDEGPMRATFAPNERPSAGAAYEGFRDDPDAGRRYREATKATRERVGTFSRGYPGAILRQGDDRQSFRMGDASVTSNVFRPGPTGGERIKAVVKAGAPVGTISEMAALSLHKSALKADGTIDPAKFNRWRTSHADALRELPEEVRARFASASLASQALDRAAAARKTRLDEFNKSVLGKVAKVDTADLPKTIGGILNAKDATAKMTQLAAAARKDPKAKDGLRRAVAEYIEGRFVSNKEAGVTGENAIRVAAFQSFVKDKAPALRLVFSGDDLKRMQAIADDIRRAERSLYAVKTPGSPGTASDLQPALDRLAKQSGEESLLTQLYKAGGFGWLVGDISGAAIGTGGVLGKRFIGSMRAAGLRKVDDLVLEMMLDPALAKAALMKAPSKPDTGSQQLLSHLLVRRSPLALAGASDEGRE